MTALLVGTALALAALLFVLYPLLFDSGAPSIAREATLTADEDAIASGGGAVEALREIEFDRATGKLSDADYAALKAEYTTAAVAELRRADALSPDAVAGLDPAELAVRRARAAAIVGGDAARTCPVHGLRPEPDALYCSDCGRYLAGHCASCGADVTREGARFCEGCGARLAA
ncbi:MAG TPA: zinc ribbon domain-containing protein [Gemmatimonadaceae bacterium]|nr:zinc ribbon domain-containing protein [Gemmatimonadaceae bacterium]